MFEVNNLTEEQIENAYQALPREEQVRINLMADKLVKELKLRVGSGHTLPFSKKMALELLAKTGIWLVKNKPVA